MLYILNNEKAHTKQLSEHDLEDLIPGVLTPIREVQEISDWQEAEKLCMPGDIIVTSTLANIATSFGGVIKKLYSLNNVRLISIQEKFDSEQYKYALNELAPVILKFESSYRMSKSKRSLSSSLDSDKFQGKSVKDIPDFPRLFDMYMKRDLNKVELAKRIGVSRPTLDRMILEYKAINDNM